MIAGELDALGEYFARNRHWLAPTASRIAGQLLDGGDLLGDALAAVVAKLVSGAPSVESVGPYLVQTMRNRVKDELRSPRSKNVKLSDQRDIPVDDYGAAFHQANTLHERRLVRRAFAQLTDTERGVLYAIAVEGLKPRDLERRISRRPDEIYVILHRAKGKLRRAILQLALAEESSEPGCRDLGGALPARLPSDLRQLRQLEPIASHLDHCESCARAWDQYTHIAELVA